MSANSVKRIGAGYSIQAFFAVWLLLLVGVPVYADAPKTVGIPGGPVFSIAVTDDATDTVYAATGVGVFKSEYGEDIWLPASEGLGSTFVYDLVPLSVTSTTVYATTKDGVYKSADAGDSWTAAGLSSIQSYTIAVHPLTSTYFAAGTDDGVYTTVDSGTTWTSLATGPPFVYSVAIEPDSPYSMYAGSFSSGVFKSTDFGITWTKTGPGPVSVNYVAIDPTTLSTVYAGTNTGLYKTTDSGTTWTKIGAEFSAVAVYKVVVDNSNTAVVYAATDKGVYKSIDTGSSWSLTNSGIATVGTQGPFVRVITPDVTFTSTLYAGTYSGMTSDVDIYKSTDSGATWEQINRELSNTIVNSLFFDPLDTDVVYAGTTTIGVIKSINGGLSWNEMNAGLTNYLVRDVVVSPDGAAVYAATSSGLFSSTDDGELWAQASPKYDVFEIAINPEEPDAIFIGTNSGIFKSIDDGTTWAPLNNNLTNPNIYAVAFDPDDTDVLYVGTNGDGIFKSESGGQSWTAINNGLGYLQVFDVAVNPDDADVLFAGTGGGGIRRTTDGGETWYVASPEETLTVNSIAVNEGDGDTLYIGTRNMGFYRSVDGGQTWVSGDESVAESTIYDVALEPGESQTLFTALEGAIEIFNYNSPPNPPASPSPADAAFTVPLNVELSWIATDPDPDDTLTYEVAIGTDPDNESVATVETASYTPEIELELNTTYYWQVTVIDDFNERTAGPVWSFKTIISNPPNTPSSPSPATGAEDQPRLPTLSWSGGDADPDDTVEYILFLGRKDEPRLRRENIAAGENGITSYTLKYPLLANTTYYWKVTAIDSNGVSSEGEQTWVFTTGQQCFAEAAALGSAEDLALLRRLNLHRLQKSPAGQALAKRYYELSPWFVQAVQNNLGLLRRTKKLLAALLPAVRQTLLHDTATVPAAVQTELFALLDEYLLAIPGDQRPDGREMKAALTSLLHP